MVAATWPGDRLPESTSGNSENLNIIICVFVHFFFFIPACLSKWSLGQSFTSLIPTPCPHRFSFCQLHGFFRDFWDQIRSEAPGLNFALIQAR